MKKWAGLLALTLVIVGIVLWHGRLSADFYPLDSSRVGPNLVASIVQWAIIALVAYLVYPPIRRKVDAELKKAHAKLDHNADLLKHSIRQNAHLIEHSKVPNETHDGIDLTAFPPHLEHPKETK